MTDQQQALVLRALRLRQDRLKAEWGDKPMCEEKARAILRGSIQEDGSIASDYEPLEYAGWSPERNDGITLDGRFTIDQLEAIAWWMRNHAKKA